MSVSTPEFEKIRNSIEKGKVTESQIQNFIINYICEQKSEIKYSKSLARDTLEKDKQIKKAFEESPSKTKQQ